MKEYEVRFERVTTGAKIIKAENIREAYKIFEDKWEDFEISVSQVGGWDPVFIEGDDGRCWTDSAQPEFEEN